MVFVILRLLPADRHRLRLEVDVCPLQICTFSPAHPSK